MKLAYLSRPAPILLAAALLTLTPLREARAWIWYSPTLPLANTISTQCRLENFWANTGYQSYFSNVPSTLDQGAIGSVVYNWQFKDSGFDIDNSAEFGFTCNGERFVLQAKGGRDDSPLIYRASVMYLHFVNPDNFAEARGLEDRGLNLIVVDANAGFAPTARINDGYAIDCAAFGGTVSGCSNNDDAFYIFLTR